LLPVGVDQIHDAILWETARCPCRCPFDSTARLKGAIHQCSGTAVSNQLSLKLLI
jgi:hypothetical protein